MTSLRIACHGRQLKTMGAINCSWLPFSGILPPTRQSRIAAAAVSAGADGAMRILSKHHSSKRSSLRSAALSPSNGETMRETVVQIQVTADVHSTRDLHPCRCLAANDEDIFGNIATNSSW